MFLTYIRCSIGNWRIDLYSPEAAAIFGRINDEGVRVFRDQSGFISYRLMRASNDVTVAIAEWESEELGKVGAENYRKWLRSSGTRLNHKAWAKFELACVASNTRPKG